MVAYSRDCSICSSVIRCKHLSTVISVADVCIVRCYRGGRNATDSERIITKVLSTDTVKQNHKDCYR